MNAFILLPSPLHLIRSSAKASQCKSNPQRSARIHSTIPASTAVRISRALCAYPILGGSNNNGNNNNNTPNKIVSDDDSHDDYTDSNAYKFLLFSGLHVPSLAYLVSIRGQRVPSYRTKPKLYLSYIILAVNVLIFVCQYYSPALLMAGAKVNSAIASGEYYRLLSPVFIHASTTHLLVNSFSLNSTGPSVESWFGKRRFLFLYFVSGMCGNYLSYLCNPSPAVGASGAIFGLVGATGVMLARHNRLLGNRARSGLASLMYIVIANFGMGMIPGSRIDNFGHLGGFLGGIAYSYLFGPNLKVRYTRSGRAIVYDQPLVKEVQRDISKRFQQTYRLLKSTTGIK